MKNFIFNIIALFTFALCINLTAFAGVAAGTTSSVEEEIIDINLVAETSSAFLDKAPTYNNEIGDLDSLFDLEIEGLTVSFKNKAAGEFSSVEWTFGDGATSDIKNAAHTYEEGGIYYFTAIISNPETGSIDFVGGNYYVQNNKLQKVTQENVNSTKVVNLF
ncbi:MAG: PKD domain-containing protein [Chitinophagales bacterium]